MTETDRPTLYVVFGKSNEDGVSQFAPLTFWNSSAGLGFRYDGGSLPRYDSGTVFFTREAMEAAIALTKKRWARCTFRVCKLEEVAHDQT